MADPTTSAAPKPLFTRAPEARESSCQAIEGVFAWGVQRCGSRGYRVVIEDGEAWTVCRAHYQGIAR